jgi:hypothetical protein
MYICDGWECGNVMFAFLIEYFEVFVYLLVDGTRQKSVIDVVDWWCFCSCLLDMYYLAQSHGNMPSFQTGSKAVWINLFGSMYGLHLVLIDGKFGTSCWEGANKICGLVLPLNKFLGFVPTIGYIRLHVCGLHP